MQHSMNSSSVILPSQLRSIFCPGREGGRKQKVNHESLCDWNENKKKTKEVVKAYKSHIPYLEQPLDLILDGLLLFAALRYLAHQLVDRGYDFLHLLLGNASIAVDVVQGEGPLQLLVDGATQQNRQVGDEFLQR